MNLIQPSNFCKVNDILTGKAIFIIPNFQRPYVWGLRQFKDLFSDLEKASKNKTNGLGGFHYLSSIHLLEIKKTVWADIIDTDNNDCNVLKDNNINPHGNPYDVYAVVDGQQRLTTLFLLANVLSKANPSLKPGEFKVKLKSGQKIPRLIQSPSEDHNYMQQLLSDYHAGNNFASPQSAAQRRLKDGLEKSHKWASNNPNSIHHLLSNDLQTSIIILDANYGLKSFLTLNDRGKPLTVLERLKAAILQAVFEDNSAALPKKFANDVHTAFGQIYKVLDKLCHTGLFKDGEEGDQEIVKLLSCYLRLDNDHNASYIWEGADTAYENYFRDTISNNHNISSILVNWLNGIKEVAEGLEHLNTCLTNSTNIPSLFFDQKSLLIDDYKAIFLSLTLQSHLIALLIKFRVITKQEEWHTRYSIKGALPVQLIQKIKNHLQDARIKAQKSSVHVLTYIKQLEKVLGDMKPVDSISMLEAVERLQVLNWNMGSRWNETFRKACRTILTNGKKAADIVNYWFLWCSGEQFLTTILTGYNDTNIRHLLREMERSLGNAIYDNDDLQLEHILSQSPENVAKFKNIDGFVGLGFKNGKEEYDNQGVWRSGNLTWLTSKCNKSISNNMVDMKAEHYTSCLNHSGGGLAGSSKIEITYKVGTELKPIGQNYSNYRWFIEARCAELAIFALKRFI